ncbi:MAG: glycosyltransferase [Chloroflexi bacterium]|nr:glycosyltransferase [Chloroflexota bacterium]
MTLIHTIIAFSYQLAGLFLTAYGFFILTSIVLFFRYRRRHDWPRQSAPDEQDIEEWPFVTVQLPIYNEPRVAARLVQAVADFDYPQDRLQIQVLDDSTDGTAAILARLVAQLRHRRQMNITYHHREDRRGYKAGALAEALPMAEGEFIAIFDADFIPPRCWLRRTLPAMLAHSDLAFVQTRWAHLNRSQNVVTAAQGLALDGHFAIEQQARSASGFWQNFNGSGGLWRRQAIESAGGWSDDTVTEDLDLSYRAQLLGWSGGYLNGVEAPAELPPVISGFRRQQRRWAKGSAQTLRKLASAIMRSDAPFTRKLYALVHLGGYAMHFPLLFLLILTLPLALSPDQTLPIPFIGLVSTMISGAPLLMYALAQHVLDGPKGLRRLWALPGLALITLGMGPAIARAVWEGLRRPGGAFERTPKQGGSGSHWLALPEDAHWREFWPELLVFLYAAVTLLVIAATNHWHLAPLPILYALGSGFVWLQGVNEQAQARMNMKRTAKKVLDIGY